MELDDIEPHTLQKMCTDAIQDVFDDDLYDDLLNTAKDERIDYQSQLKDYVKTL